MIADAVLQFGEEHGWTEEESRAAAALAHVRRELRNRGMLDEEDAPQQATEAVKTDKAGHHYCTEPGKGRVPCPQDAAPSPHHSRVHKVLARVKEGKVGQAAGWTAAKYKQVMDTRGGRAWKWVEHRLTVLLRYTQRLALQAARERGKSEEDVERTARIMAIIDLAGTFGTAFVGGLVGSAFGPVGVVAGKTIGSATPSWSVISLMYSTARNPAATLRTARKAVLGQLPQLPGHDKAAKKNEGTESVIENIELYGAILDRLEQFRGDEESKALYESMLATSVDVLADTEGGEPLDPMEVIQLADDAYEAFLMEMGGTESVEEPPDEPDPLAPLFNRGNATEAGFTGEKKVMVRGKEQTWYYRDGRRIANPNKKESAPRAKKSAADKPKVPTIGVDETHAKLAAGEMSVEDLAGQKWKKADWQALSKKLGDTRKSGTVAQLQDRIRDALKPKEGGGSPTDKLTALSALAKEAKGKGGYAGLSGEQKAAVKAFVAEHPELAQLMAEAHQASKAGSGTGGAAKPKPEGKAKPGDKGEFSPPELSDEGRRVVQMYERSGDISIPDSQFLAAFDGLESLPRGQLVAIAEEIEMVGTRSASRSKLAKSIKDRAIARRGATKRAKLIDRPNAASTESKPPEPGFSGVDANGHHWENGVQVAKPEETPASGEPQPSEPEGQDLDWLDDGVGSYMDDDWGFSDPVYDGSSVANEPGDAGSIYASEVTAEDRPYLTKEFAAKLKGAVKEHSNASLDDAWPAGGRGHWMGADQWDDIRQELGMSGPEFRAMAGALMKTGVIAPGGVIQKDRAEREFGRDRIEEMGLIPIKQGQSMGGGATNTEYDGYINGFRIMRGGEYESGKYEGSAGGTEPASSQSQSSPPPEPKKPRKPRASEPKSSPAATTPTESPEYRQKKIARAVHDAIQDARDTYSIPDARMDAVFKKVREHYPEATKEEIHQVIRAENAAGRVNLTPRNKYEHDYPGEDLSIPMAGGRNIDMVGQVSSSSLHPHSTKALGPLEKAES